MSDIDARFQEFHQANPHVLTDLEKKAAHALSRGAKRIGIKCLWEVLRYEYALLGSPTKMSNSYTSRFARLMLFRNPKLEAVIETRPLRTESSVGVEQTSELEDFISWMRLS